MDTATQEPTKPSEPTDSAAHGAAPAPIDPEHDIDAKTTIAWLVVGIVFVAVSMWALGLFFSFSVAAEHKVKIDEVPKMELRALRSNEDYSLKKTMPQGADDKRDLREIEASIHESTDAIIKKYLRK